MTTSFDTPLILCAAVTGGAAPFSRTPHHPTTPEKLVEETIACAEAGATLVHLHARDAKGNATMEPGTYRALKDAIRAKGCEVVLNFSAGDNGGTASHEERRAVAHVGADMVSFGAGSFNTGSRLYDNRPDYIESMARALDTAGVTPEIEIFDFGQLQSVCAMVEAGLIASPVSLQFVFGVPGGMPSDLRLLDALIDRLPDECHWSVCCQSSDYTTWRQMMLHAFLRGGHIRTGMEDVVFQRPGKLATSNAQLVAQWVETARIWGRPVMSSQELRTEIGRT